MSVEHRWKYAGYCYHLGTLFKYLTAEMANWAPCPLIQPHCLLWWCTAPDQKRDTFIFFFCYTWAVNSDNKRPVCVRAWRIWSLSWWCSSFTDNGLVNWDSLPLHSESPWILSESVLKLPALPRWSHTDVVFASYSWKVVTVSSPTPDDSVDLRLWRCVGGGVFFDFVFSSIPLSILAFSLPQIKV